MGHTRPMEVWVHGFSFPRRVAELARRTEAWGFDGLVVADSQNLNADVWVELALAGAVTSRLRLGPGVTNLATRHPAVTASAVATLQSETGGRAVLGVGRGDSAITQIGEEPAPVEEFERRLATVQAYLRGKEVTSGPVASTIRWLPEDGVPKVPLRVAATGRRTVEAAARQAEGIDFTVGAEPERVRWAVGVARAAAAEVSLGAYLNVAVDPKRQVARELVRGSVSVFARFSAEGPGRDGLSEVTRAGIEALASGYEEASHGSSDAPYAKRLDDAFLDRFAVAGPPGEVLDRLLELGETGLDRVVVVPGSLDAAPKLVSETLARFAEKVLPDLAG